MSKKVRIPRNKTVPEEPPSVPPSDWPLVVCFSLLAGFFTLAFVFSTIVPFFQMATYLEDIRKNRVQKVMKSDFIFSPYTVAQRLIRYEFLKYLEEQKLGASDIALLDGAIAKMEESVVIEGSSPYQYLRLGRALEKKVEILHDPSYLKQAEKYYKKAIALAPKRQEVAYSYGLSLIRQGKDRVDEAVSLLTQSLDKTIPISYFYLGLAEFNMGNQSYASSLEHLEAYFETKQDNPYQGTSQDLYEKLFHYYYGTQDKQRVLMTAARLVSFHSDPQERYQKVIAFINKNNQLPPLQFNGYKLSSVGGP